MDSQHKGIFSEYMRVWEPEKILVGWIGASFILMTLSLLFYHMVRLSSLEMPPKIASLFAVGLILSSLLFCGSAIYSYDSRVRDVLASSDLPDTAHQKEKRFSAMYTWICCLVGLIQLGVVVTIVRGAFPEFKGFSKSPPL